MLAKRSHRRSLFFDGKTLDGWLQIENNAEVLAFRDATAGKNGPIAWQMHNAGLFDEYKDVAIEVNPKDNDSSMVG